MNATKFGLYGSRLIVEVGDGKESEEEWSVFLEAALEAWDPVGLWEHQLVERLASLHWRLLRVTRCETGEIRTNLDNALHELQAAVKRNATAYILLGNWGANSAAIEIVISWLEAAIELAEAGEEIPDNLFDQLKGSGVNLERGTPLKHCKFLAGEFKEAKGRSAEEAKQVQAELVEFLFSTMELFRGLLPAQLEREQLMAEARVRAFSIPPEHTLNRLIRYENNVRRQVEATRAELEAVQRKRKQRSGPISVPIDFAKKSEPGEQN